MTTDKNAARHRALHLAGLFWHLSRLGCTFQNLRCFVVLRLAAAMLSCPGAPPVRDLCNRDDKDTQSRGHEQVDSADDKFAMYLPKRVQDKMARKKKEQEELHRAMDKVIASLKKLDESTRYLEPNPELDVTGGESPPSLERSSSTVMDLPTHEQVDSANDEFAMYMPKRVQDKMARNKKKQEELDRAMDKLIASLKKLDESTRSLEPNPELDNLFTTV